jgi:capsular exopolysaccharide synthesis family protein
LDNKGAPRFSLPGQGSLSDRRLRKAAEGRNTVLNPRDSAHPLFEDMWSANRPALCTMEHMYDHFYKVLWKLLLRVNRQSGTAQPILGGKKDDSGNAAKKTGYAMTFAGCRRGDGASTMAFNFARAFASYSSRSLLLVDGNVRDPVLHLQFTTEKRAGLTDLVEGKVTVEEAVMEITRGKYYFLRSGARSVNPMMLFESPEFFSVMEQFRERYDVIIVDSPPLMDNQEAALLASATDGLVMVLQADKTRWEVALSAVKDLEGAGVPVLGAILNKKQLLIPEPLYRLL